MHNSARSLGRRYRTPFHTYCTPWAGERYRRQSGMPKGGGKRLQRLRSSSHAPRRSLFSKAANHSLSERAAMITPDYIRTMAEFNAEMNRRLYGAAARLSDPERRQPRGAFWGSIHGTLTHILWGDQQWMSRFDAWPRPSTPIKQSAGMIEDFAVFRAEREKADAGISHRRTRSTTHGSPRTSPGSAGLPTARSAHRCGCCDPLLQPPDPSPWAGPRYADRSRPRDRRHRPVPGDPRYRRP